MRAHNVASLLTVWMNSPSVFCACLSTTSAVYYTAVFQPPQVSLASLEDYWFNHWEGPFVTADSNQNTVNFRRSRRSLRKSKRKFRCSICHRKVWLGSSCHRRVVSNIRSVQLVRTLQCVHNSHDERMLLWKIQGRPWCLLLCLVWEYSFCRQKFLSITLVF